MIQVCSVCGTIYGEKAPLDDQSLTHGYCPPCLDAELKKLNELAGAHPVCPAVAFSNEPVVRVPINQERAGRTNERFTL